MKPNKEFRKIREKLELTQFEYGKKLGISRDRVRDYEGGKRARLPAEIFEAARGLYEEEFGLS